MIHYYIVWPHAPYKNHSSVLKICRFLFFFLLPHTNPKTAIEMVYFDRYSLMNRHFSRSYAREWKKTRAALFFYYLRKTSSAFCRARKRIVRWHICLYNRICVLVSMHQCRSCWTKEKKMRNSNNWIAAIKMTQKNEQLSVTVLFFFFFQHIIACGLS